ncbi:hypothetical protein KOAAANKH_01513 [Brevundimonas sp. NIBR10]|uniref:DUF2849 domain-containing protein n=1 Tax=Brevundimonas sp. NIBR10 TaxID=3015997 RepID=UPI0022F15ACD|nr:DUF2849 domain-containing protein [Brevundimonas sp. NIBR10]WGM46640.1 hypothetical protein KOAAANKH_01513 [Brevundimonas sp. NIBR10]
MKIVTANRLSDGRVIYLGPDAAVVEDLALAALFDADAADAALIAAASKPATWVNPYLVEVTDGPTPSGRDRLKETIRSAGPTVGNSLNHREPA